MMNVQRLLQSKTLPSIFCFPGVTRRNSRDKVRVNDSRLEQIQFSRISIITHPIIAEKIFRPIQPGCAQHLLTRPALVFEIVNRETCARMPHAEMLIHFPQQHRYERGLPIVTVNNFGMLATLHKELHCRTTEKREAQHIIVLTVKNSAIEKVVCRMRINEEAFAT